MIRRHQRFAAIYAALALSALAALIVGCHTPQQTAFTTLTGFRTGVHEMEALQQQGVLTGATLQQAVLAAEAAWPFVQEYDRAAQTGDQYAIDNAYAAAFPKVEAFLLALDNAKKAAAH